MKSLILTILSTLVFLGYVSARGSDPLLSFSAANNDFGTRLFQALRQINDENFFFSPLSLSIAFGMLYHGAGGHTAKELNQVLGYQSAGLPNQHLVSHALELYMNTTRSLEYELNLANCILVDLSLNVNDQYRSAMYRIFDSVVENADFRIDHAEIRDKINSWVDRKTKGMIPSLLDKVDPRNVMVILNAAYFKGLWKKPFDPKKTSPQLFYNFGKTPKMVQMMKMHDRSLAYFSQGTFKALMLPYKGNASMLILFVDYETGFTNLEDSISASFIANILSHMRPVNVKVHLPKFQAESSFSLQDPMQTLGMRSVFVPRADFSGISRSRGVKISGVVHKATVIVDEVGTVAAAATATSATRSLNKPIEFVVNRPFIYAIIDTTTNLVLFIGRVCQL